MAVMDIKQPMEVNVINLIMKQKKEMLMLVWLIYANIIFSKYNHDHFKVTCCSFAVEHKQNKAISQFGGTQMPCERPLPYIK
jgi:hypothetical protein